MIRSGETLHWVVQNYGTNRLLVASQPVKHGQKAKRTELYIYSIYYILKKDQPILPCSGASIPATYRINSSLPECLDL